jgi:hypothetical protein
MKGVLVKFVVMSTDCLLVGDPPAVATGLGKDGEFSRYEDAEQAIRNRLETAATPHLQMWIRKVYSFGELGD